jgi:hypothetical protein
VSTWDDADVRYKPKLRDDIGDGWGVWDKASQRFVNHRKLTERDAVKQATKANDSEAVAEEATWD